MNRDAIHSLTNIDREKGTADCSVCGPTTIKVKTNNVPRCRVRVNYERRWYYIRRTYGISKQEYENLLHLQRGGCAICHGEQSEGMWLAVDHDHQTGEIRGLLCQRCNLGIGHLRDNVEHLQAAVDYLTREATPQGTWQTNPPGHLADEPPRALGREIVTFKGREYFTVGAFAKYCGVSRGTALLWQRQGKLPNPAEITPEGRKLWSPVQVKAFSAERKHRLSEEAARRGSSLVALQVAELRR